MKKRIASTIILLTLAFGYHAYGVWADQQLLISALDGFLSAPEVASLERRTRGGDTYAATVLSIVWVQLQGPHPRTVARLSLTGSGIAKILSKSAYDTDRTRAAELWLADQKCEVLLQPDFVQDVRSVLKPTLRAEIAQAKADEGCS